MDTITTSILKEFTDSHQLNHLKEDSRFEHFCAFVTLRRHHARTFDTTDIVVGKGGDTGIDSISIIVNGALITDIDEIEELATRNGYLEANFIFSQAERSSSFDGSKIGSFGFGVEDFFKSEPSLPRNPKIVEASAIVQAIFKRGNLIRTKPTCRLYYVTTGKWVEDKALNARKAASIAALEATQLFSSVEFTCYGADEIHRLYNQTKTAITRDFVFRDRTEPPKITGVKQAFLGFVPAREFIKIISDDSGDDILGSIFDDNVRDWQNYNKVNAEMKQTLESANRERFVLMNNGVTVIARSITQLGSEFQIKDFQIVNGCQTSHVIFDQKQNDLDSVCIPLRLIVTEDDDVKESIIKATNRQTELKPEQLYALTDFARALELFFKAYDMPYQLYYERRDCQYDRFPDIEKTRIVTPTALIKSFGAMFLDEPTRVTRNYKSIRDLVGEQIFKEGHRLESYYAAAWASYRLEFLFRTQRLDSSFKAARYHILTALRYLINSQQRPQLGSMDMKKRADEIIGILWDQTTAEDYLNRAALTVKQVVEGRGEDFDRDHIRTEPTKTALLKHFGVRVHHD